MIEPGTLSGILAFVEVAEAGSFTRAAERLRLTKSAVGKSVAQMEQRLGARLINRTTRSLSLTADGEAYYEACARALSGIADAQNLIAEQRQRPAGRLRVELPLAFGRRRVVSVLLGLAKTYPALRLEIGFNDRRVGLSDEGIDLTIRIGQLDDNTGLVARRLCSQRSLLCAAPAYLDAFGWPNTSEELGAHALLVYGRNDFLNPWRLPDGSGGTTLYRPAPKMVLGDGEALYDAVLAGCGVAFLPTWLIGDALADGRLLPVTSDMPVETAPIHALWSATRTMPPRLRVAIDTLVAHFATTPDGTP